jgi:organic radical activating enzyme
MENVRLMHHNDIASRAATLVAEAKGSTSDYHIVLTGGEPLLYRDQLPSAIDALRRTGFPFIEVETNGTIAPSESLQLQIDWWNCSPKLSNSGLDRGIRLHDDALATFASMRNVDFKFVVASDVDITEIENDFGSYITSDNVMIMAEGTSSVRAANASKNLLARCIPGKYRFSPRLHVLLWGNERGR